MLVVPNCMVSAENAADTTAAASISEGYSLVAESDSLALYADMTTGYFDLVDKKTGTVYPSIAPSLDEDKITPNNDKFNLKSHLIVDYIIEEGFIGSGVTYRINSLTECVNMGDLTVSEIKNGIKVEFNFSSYGIVIPVEYTIEDDCFKAKIDTKKLKEGKETMLYRVQLLPSFAAGSWAENGYIFVPDGTGALISFNNGELNNTYSEQVYGEEGADNVLAKYSNTEKIRMPVFGVAKEGNGLVGIITKGDTSAYINATVGNEACGINSVCAMMEYRTVGKDKMLSQSTAFSYLYRVSETAFKNVDFEVCYKVLSGDDADYVGMANVYRDYLINEKGLKKSTANASLMNLNVYGAVEENANFLGYKYKKLKPVTDYEQVEEIVDELDMDDISVKLIGWQNDGIYNAKPLKKSKLIGTLGSRSDFRGMLKDLGEEDVTVWCDADLINKEEGNNRNTATTLFKKKYYQYKYLPSTYVTDIMTDPWTMVNQKTLIKNSNSYMKSLDKNIKNVSLSTLSNFLYGDFNPSNPTSRTEMAASMVEVMKKFADGGYVVSGEQANAYAIPYLSAIYNAPTLNSGYKLFDKEVPFYQIVLQGYVPMTGAAKQSEITADTEFLKAVETGTGLLYNCIYGDSDIFHGKREDNLYSSTYTLWADTAKAQYDKYSELYSRVCDEQIIDHKELAKNVMQTTFSDGTVVTVNYNYDAASVEGVSVEARSFIINGEAN